MKIKFFLLVFLLLFARGCDFYSTSLWFFDDPSGEQNMLYRFFGLGWTGLLVTNAVLIAIIIYCFYYYTYRYRIDKAASKPLKLTTYISERYFNESNRFYQVFYKTPKNRNTLLGHVGYILIRVVIIASFLATVHNLCQYYNVSFYNSFRDVVGRPLYVIYGLILLSFVLLVWRLWLREYKIARRLFDSVR